MRSNVTCKSNKITTSSLFVRVCFLVCYSFLLLQMADLLWRNQRWEEGDGDTVMGKEMLMLGERDVAAGERNIVWLPLEAGWRRWRRQWGLPLCSVWGRNDYGVVRRKREEEGRHVWVYKGEALCCLREEMETGGGWFKFGQRDGRAERWEIRYGKKEEGQCAGRLREGWEGVGGGRLV